MMEFIQGIKAAFLKAESAQGWISRICKGSLLLNIRNLQKENAEMFNFKNKT